MMLDEAFAAASRRLRRSVPYDAAVWLATDPATRLPCGPAWLEDVDAGDVRRAWEHELLGGDSSPRYRAAGFGDELRAALRVDGTTWGTLTLLREGGQPAFERRDLERVAEHSRPLAEALRDHARAPTARAEERGVMLLEPGGAPIAADDEVLQLLGELAGNGVAGELPLAAAITLVAARAVAERLLAGPARIRVRSQAGHWLAFEASCLTDGAGTITATALVIEPAAGEEIAAIAVRACGLTQRERQIAQLITGGCSTSEIARRLHLSTHTVRDYVKSIFDKAGVSSRGELVARLIGWPAREPASPPVPQRVAAGLRPAHGRSLDVRRDGQDRDVEATPIER